MLGHTGKELVTSLTSRYLSHRAWLKFHSISKRHQGVPPSFYGARSHSPKPERTRAQLSVWVKTLALSQKPESLQQPTYKTSRYFRAAIVHFGLCCKFDTPSIVCESEGFKKCAPSASHSGRTHCSLLGSEVCKVGVQSRVYSDLGFRGLGFRV